MTAAPETTSETVMTSRGWGLIGFGVMAGGVGVGLANPILVYAGVTMVSAVVVAGLWMLLSINTFLRRFPYARREVIPRPLTAGVPGKVIVSIQSGNAASAARSRLRRTLTNSLDIREQAASELTGGMGTKATVARTETSLTLTYTLLPSRRGRWPLGPALVHSSDPFGVLWADTSVGEAEHIPVWPPVVDLSAAAGALMGHADRVVIGARTPSADDASLRDYREGDDLRRVHWPSSARRGTMLVRSDERAGRRPATVIMDLPRDPVALEWSITAAASIALSVLDAGHPVRLLGAGLNPDASRHVGEHGAEAGRSAILNQTVDLKSPVSINAATAHLIHAANQAAHDATHGEVIVGVFEPLERDALDALVPLGDSGRAWAMVRTSDNVAQAETAQETMRSLRRAGWRTATASTNGDLENIWASMITAGDME
ncbi:MAG: DUF58 domain-containing protein [Actinobacteria bacterium HGW-Actinobacteria-4]|nr:MAG: DUF58 domain-containing protein [Actinobacteria bacterium HGW-Actinobacteria-4]